MAENSAPFPVDQNPSPRNSFSAAPAPQLTIDACHVECPASPSGCLTFYLDVREVRSGINLRDLVVELEKGYWMVLWGVPGRSSMGYPHASADTPVVPQSIAPYSEEEFEAALIAEFKKRCLNLFLICEFESRQIPDFRKSVLDLDWDLNRVAVC